MSVDEDQDGSRGGKEGWKGSGASIEAEMSVNIKGKPGKVKW
jgi:hypothetical protein